MDIGIISVIVAVVIGVPPIWYARRQTRIAESAHSSNNSKKTNNVEVLTRIRDFKKVRVGYIHYPPFTAASNDGVDGPTGLYVDLLQRLCESESLNLEFEQIRFSSAVKDVADGKYDIVLSIFQTPKRSRQVDFTALMHTVSVSGVVRRQENRISSQSDLMEHKLKFVVCCEEIGHEILVDHLRIPTNQVIIIDTSNIADIIDMVATKKADIAIADSLSCQHGLAARGAEGPKLKPVLRSRPIFLCQNGVMIGRNQEPLANWLNKGMRELLKSPEFKSSEQLILDEFHGIISKL